MKWLSLPALSLAVLPASLPAQTFTQWNPASGGNGHFYGVTPSASNWTQAEAYAAAAGGHLASITSAGEQAFIAATFLTGTLAQSPLWIGLTDQAVEGTFTWTTGEPTGVTYWNTSTGEPNNEFGNEDYGVINWHRAQAPGNPAGTWNDTPLNGTTIHGGNTDGPYFGLIEIACPVPAGPVTNGSFENTGGTFAGNAQGYMNVAATSTTIPGWTVTHQGLSWLVSPNAFSLTAAEGRYFLDLTSTADNSIFGGVTQTIPTDPGTTYTLGFSIGTGGSTGQFGGTKSVLASAGSTSQTFTFAPTGTGSQWGAFALTFTASASTTVVSFHGTAAGSGNQYLGLDNVSVLAISSAPAPFLREGSAAGSWFFSWPATPGVSYQVQTSTDLLAWLNDGPASPASGNVMARLLNTHPNTPRLFVRSRPVP